VRTKSGVGARNLVAQEIIGSNRCLEGCKSSRNILVEQKPKKVKTDLGKKRSKKEIIVHS